MRRNIFNEDSRVKIPAILHFKRLMYQYQSKKDTNISTKNNIFVDIFKDSIIKINKCNYKDEKINDLIKEIGILTDNTKDKGEDFFNRLVSTNGIKLLDLKIPLKA